MQHALRAVARNVLRDPASVRRGRERAFLARASASPLERHLWPLAKRLHRQRTLEYLPYAALLASIVAVVFAAVGRLFGVPALSWAGLAFGTIFGLFAVARVARRPVGPFEAARYADAALLLRERLATALELLDARASGLLPERQVQDAVAVAGRYSPRAAFPFFPPGSESRRSALRRTTIATAAFAAALILALWPAADPAANRAAGSERLALADPGRRDEPVVDPASARDASAGVQALTGRPDDVGDSPGLLGQQPNPGNQGSQPGDPNQANRGDQASLDAQRQQNASIAERQQALQDLGNALRQSQTGRQAGDSLRRGDTQRASEQLGQMANQVQNLSPGERQSLSQAFQQASQQIGDRDRGLADAARRAAEALSQFRNQDAQQAIRDTARQVQDIGQQAQQQRELQQRSQNLQQGGQPQLPQSAQQPGQQGQAQQGQGQQGQRSQQANAGANQAQSRQGGDGQPAGGLSELEAALRGGGLEGGGSGQGAGAGAGSQPTGPANRLQVEARTITVEAEVGEGPTQWRPPNPNAPPAGQAAPASPPSVPGVPASAAPVGAGPDTNRVPWDLIGAVRDYFTPRRERP